MGRYFYLYNQTRDVQLSLGKKSLYEFQEDIRRALSLGWTLDESWQIVDDEDTQIDPAKVIQ